MANEHLKLALRNLKQRKLRSGLTVLGIVIAVATIFVLISLSLGLQKAVEEQFRILGTDKIFIQPRGQLAGPGTTGAVELTEKDTAVVEKVRGVKDLSWSISAPAEINFGDQKRFFNVVGFPLDKADVFVESGAYKADEGRLLAQDDQGKIMIGSQYKYNQLFKKPVGERDKIEINGKELRVVGILKPIGNPGDDRIIYMGLKEFKEIFHTGERIDFIIVQIEKGEDIQEVSKRIEKALFGSRDVDKDTKDFTILTPEELLQTFGDILNIVTVFLVAVAAISLIVGGINVANTMFTSVLERTKEIGIMKSVGARNSDIILIFLIESGFLGLMGGIIGIILGTIIGKTIEYVAINQIGTTLLKISIPVYLIVGCLLFAFLIGGIFGTLPAFGASKVKPTEALRYE